MSFDISLSTNNLVHIALLMQCLAMLVRDELWLRGLLLSGTFFYISYYFFHADPPLWDAIFASATIGTVNIALIIVIIHERTLLAMSDEDTELYARFNVLSPGQFRKIAKAGKWQTAAEEVELTREGEVPQRLYFLSDGQIRITKKDHTTLLPCDKFIGEIAFLSGGPASATTSALPGTRFISWDFRDLKRLKEKDRTLDHAITVLLSHDLSGKVASSTVADDAIPAGVGPV